MMASKEDTLELPQLSHLKGEEAEGLSSMETSPGRETHPPPSTMLGKLLIMGRVPSPDPGYCLPHWTPPTLRTSHLLSSGCTFVPWQEGVSERA